MRIDMSDGSLKIDTIDEKKLKGYQFDSLVYRYIRAREQMAEYEYLRDPSKICSRKFYYEQAQKDILRFCRILDDMVGEHE